MAWPSRKNNETRRKLAPFSVESGVREWEHFMHFDVFMKIKCIKCSSQVPKSDKFPKNIVRYGFFYRTSDRKRVQRFRCNICNANFSSATFSLCYRQKKRHLNHRVVWEMVTKVSQRDCHRKLKINRKTVARKLVFMGILAKKKLHVLNSKRKFSEIEFDDMETFEHTKCKPVSITLAVEAQTRWIIGYEVAQMPANGPLASVSRKKYGPRADLRPRARNILFERLQKLVKPDALIKSDRNPHYLAIVRNYFPKGRHVTYKGRKGCIVGQGELKKIGYDPLFSLNHTCATLRSRANRLVRRTWDTTKKIERLDLHLALVAIHHNSQLKA